MKVNSSSKLQPKDFVKIFKPETELEEYLLHTPEFTQGLNWGIPRYGHPEGEVWRHLIDVFQNIETLYPLNHIDRRDLRIVTLLHDTFKYAEDRTEPRDWSKHHGVLAKEFAAKYISNPRVLKLIEFHDEAFYCWRIEAIHHKKNVARQRLDRLLYMFDGDIDIYYKFMVCDTYTGDKTPRSVYWFHEVSETRLKKKLWQPSV